MRIGASTGAFEIGPTTGPGAPSLDVDEDRMILTITREKKIFLGETELPFSTLKDKLVGNIKLKHDKPLNRPWLSAKVRGTCGF